LLDSYTTFFSLMALGIANFLTRHNLIWQIGARFHLVMALGFMTGARFRHRYCRIRWVLQQNTIFLYPDTKLALPRHTYCM
jgi:hypothetical protein